MDLYQLLDNVLVEDFLHGQGQDDFVAALENDSISCNASDECDYFRSDGRQSAHYSGGGGKFEPAHAGCYYEMDVRPARQSICFLAGANVAPAFGHDAHCDAPYSIE